jgi:hypothetical protein
VYRILALLFYLLPFGLVPETCRVAILGKRARVGNYAVNTLSGLKTYYGDFLKERGTLAKAQAAAADRLRVEQAKRPIQTYAVNNAKILPT